MADAAQVILTRDAGEFTGNFCIDDEVLRSAGITDLTRYQETDIAETDLISDFFV